SNPSDGQRRGRGPLASVPAGGTPLDAGQPGRARRPRKDVSIPFHIGLDARAPGRRVSAPCGHAHSSRERVAPGVHAFARARRGRGSVRVSAPRTIRRHTGGRGTPAGFLRGGPRTGRGEGLAPGARAVPSRADPDAGTPASAPLASDPATRTGAGTGGPGRRDRDSVPRFVVLASGGRKGPHTMPRGDGEPRAGDSVRTRPRRGRPGTARGPVAGGGPGVPRGQGLRRGPRLLRPTPTR